MLYRACQWGGACSGNSRRKRPMRERVRCEYGARGCGRGLSLGFAVGTRFCTLKDVDRSCQMLPVRRRRTTLSQPARAGPAHPQLQREACCQSATLPASPCYDDILISPAALAEQLPAAVATPSPSPSPSAAPARRLLPAQLMRLHLPISSGRAGADAAEHAKTAPAGWASVAHCTLRRQPIRSSRRQQPPPPIYARTRAGEGLSGAPSSARAWSCPLDGSGIGICDSRLVSLPAACASTRRRRSGLCGTA